MRLRITSPGHSVQVENTETGELLEGVAHVHWSCDTDGFPKAIIAIEGTAAEIDAIVDDS